MAIGEEDISQQKRIIPLSEAIELGIKNSYTLEIQDERINQSIAIQRKALALLLPVLTAQGTYTRYDKEVVMKFPDINSLKISITEPYISFTKYNNYVIQKENSFGALASLNLPIINIPNYLTYKNAKDSTKITELNKESQKADLIYNIATAYLNTISIKKSIAITKNSVELARLHLRIVEAKLKNGDANELTLTKARLDLERALNDSEKAEKAYSIAIEGLALLLNIDKDFDVEDSVSINMDSSFDIEKLTEIALKRRPDVKILAENRELIQRDINLSMSRLLPTLNMNAVYRYSDITNFVGEETQWFIIFSLNLNLYDGGLRYAEIREKRSRLNENELQIRQLKEGIKSQISQNIKEIESCKRNISSLERQLELARKSYDLSVKSYNAGVISQSELIDSEIIVTNTELLLEKEKNDCLIYYIKLLKNTGDINSFKGK
ncbi:MAG: TolC family protein [Myxococcota bacterium]